VIETFRLFGELIASHLDTHDRLAARRERSLQVSRWSALHHSAVGDPLSWEDR
jgi:hypothetical protein